MSNSCQRCGRPILYPYRDYRNATKHIAEAIVVHAYYGCDTGCCGHTVEGIDCDGETVFTKFEFAHPYSDEPATWARSLADSLLPGVPLKWEDCEISDD